MINASIAREGSNFRWFLTTSVIWSLLVSGSFYWNYRSEHINMINQVTTEARAHFNKDKAFRFWAASHGGVYVPVDERTQPNPRLSHIPERDITTPSGKQLTLMNPAYMLRAMMQEYEQLFGVKGKITSFPDKLFYQGNMPDAWELDALQSFLHGAREKSGIADIGGEPYMRLMRPLYIRQDCMKCHAVQGYKVGDLRGGVGVAVAMQPYLESESKHLSMLVISHLLLWLSGVLVLAYFYVRAKAQDADLHNMEQQFFQSQKMEALGTLVGGIAHDFNNILAGLTGNLYLAKQQASEMPEVLKKLENCEQLSFHAAEMIRQLLTFARKDRVSMQPLPLVPFLKETLKFMRTSLPENISMQQDICSDSLIINGDATQLHQVMMNLINNARDALQESRDPCINVSLNVLKVDAQSSDHPAGLNAGTYAHLSVSDNGIGIAESDQDMIFEPFYTTKNGKP